MAYVAMAYIVMTAGPSSNLKPGTSAIVTGSAFSFSSLALHISFRHWLCILVFVTPLHIIYRRRFYCMTHSSLWRQTGRSHGYTTQVGGSIVNLVRQLALGHDMCSDMRSDTRSDTCLDPRLGLDTSSSGQSLLGIVNSDRHRQSTPSTLRHICGHRQYKPERVELIVIVNTSQRGWS